MRKNYWKLFLVLIVLGIFDWGVLFSPDFCLAQEKYQPGETARAFHDSVTSFPTSYKADREPDFGQRFSKTVYEKKASLWWGARCKIQTEALKKYLYRVSVEVDSNFPDIQAYQALNWAFHCLTAVVEEKYQPASYSEADKAFRSLWGQINDQWMKGDSGPRNTFQTSAFSVVIIASSDGEKNFLIMHLPQADRADRLKKLERKEKELDELCKRFSELKKKISLQELDALASSWASMASLVPRGERCFVSPVLRRYLELQTDILSLTIGIDPD